MKTDRIGRGAVVALLMLAPLGAGATSTPDDREKPSQGRATPSEIALERAQGLALGFRVDDLGGSPAAVPEPSAALLFAGGLLVAGATRRFRSR